MGELRLGDEITCVIERLGIYGEGVAYLDGFTLFVEGALPGEKVRAKVYERRRRFGRAHVVSVETGSAHRVEPVCPLFGKCGGCQVMHLSYEEQLAQKRQRVVDALERVGKLFGVEVLPCVPSESKLNYRNKIQLPIRGSAGALRLGLYAHDSHDLVEIDRCHIHAPLGEEVFQEIQKLIKSSSLSAFDFRTGEGLLRFVLIRTAFFTQEILVILITNGEGGEELRALAEKIMQVHPKIKGVVQSVNRARDNVVLGDEYRTLAGEGAIEEKLCGLSFKVSPASFFQVNPPQAQKLYERVVERCGLTGEERVLDAFCGVGTIALILAQHAKEVIGVEWVPEAIADAEENAIRNKISNAKFVCAPAENYIQELDAADVAVLNPPRKGCEKALIDKLIQLKPKKIIYISCDPATLARDLALLCAAGYTLNSVEPFDMFPQTAHVESLATLSFS